MDVCVIIPTYNNGGALVDVIDRTLSQGLYLFVVNDGSTDNTATILNDYREQLAVISYPVNKGKGFALRQGFAAAVEAGFLYAIVLDSDGQHDPANIRLFIDKLNETGEAIIVGNRTQIDGHVPVKNTFGRRFSNFWFLVETWQKCQDTQCGFRLYPLRPLMKRRFYTTRFEFEIEALVRLAWDNIPVQEVDIAVRYFPEGERVSHFRPATDFLRISALNSVLFTMSYLWFLPRLFVLKMSNKTWKDILLNPHESRLTKAQSLAFGVFMGIIPLWGFQMLIALAFAAMLRLNKTLVLLASNISLPPMIPAILFGSLWFGGIVLNTEQTRTYSRDISIDNLGDMLLQYIIGSIVLATTVAVTVFGISYSILSIINRKKVKS
jgi:glycosyltransferase involved in cell wall biosynthesis